MELDLPSMENRESRLGGIDRVTTWGDESLRQPSRSLVSLETLAVCGGSVGAVTLVLVRLHLCLTSVGDSVGVSVVGHYR